MKNKKKKVKLPIKVAKSLENELLNRSADTVITLHSIGNGFWKDKSSGLNGLPMVTLRSAIRNGYDILG